MRSKWFVLLVATLATASLWGCGSNGGSGGSAVTPTDGGPTTELLGISNCSNCHSAQIAAWKDGRHGNIAGANDPSPTGPHEPAAAGEPLSCGNCHNETLDATNMPAAFNVSIRDVVACESCHGGGSAHRGIGPIPVPIPGVDACAKCHAEVDATTGETIALRSRGGHSPAATTAVTDYLISGHAGDPRDRSTRSDAIGCNRCHSDEGAKLYRGLSTVAAITATNGRGAEPLGMENITPIQCRTCHDVHETGGNKLLIDATADASAQYNTCNHCHAGDNDDLNYHVGHADDNGLLDRELTDTHYDDPATGYGLTTDLIEGYVIRKQADTACSDCHNVHSGDNTINIQWANSAHGGFILQEKINAVAAGGDPTTSGANGDDSSWPHYDWDAANRASCQRCHTATGAANFMSDPTGYVAANNDFSHIAGGQNEMLYCWGCHDNAAAGTLRDPGAIVETYTATTAGNPPTTVEYPDVSGSNLCMTCHLGREVGENIKNDTDADGVRSFINSHYLAAGATLFGESGYEYDGRNYDDPDAFVHAKVGMGLDVVTGNANYDAVRGNYTNGPCVTCHFTSNDGSHSLSPVTEYAPGDVSLNPVCVECHTTRGTGNAAQTWLSDTWQARYQGALDALNNQLAAKGIHFYEAHPYFYQAADGQGGAYTNWAGVYGLGLWKDTMGAAFNYNLLAHDPGGVAHNRYYTRRLIYDAIDYIDNGVLDYSVFATLNAIPDGTDYKANAITYIINRGTADANVGTAAERY